MKTKKLVSLIMAGAMTLALAVPAFATATTVTFEADNTLSYEAKVNTVTIAVTLPPSTDNVLVLNPYGQEYEISTGNTAKDQIIFPEQSISSTTPVPLSVSAKIKVEVGSDVKLATTSVAATEAKKALTDKQIFLYLAIEDESGAMDEEGYAYDSKATNQMLFTAKDTTKDGMITIEAGDGTAANAKSVYYKVLGSCSSQPLTAWDAEKDTVKLSTAFAFIANPITEED